MISSAEKEIIKQTTCFKEHEKAKIKCDKSSCRLWIDYPQALNCTIIAAKDGPRTLQLVGDIFDITRMRICQIEKNALKKLNKKKHKIF